MSTVIAISRLFNFGDTLAGSLMKLRPSALLRTEIEELLEKHEEPATWATN